MLQVLAQFLEYMKASILDWTLSTMVARRPPHPAVWAELPPLVVLLKVKNSKSRKSCGSWHCSGAILDQLSQFVHSGVLVPLFEFVLSKRETCYHWFWHISYGLQADNLCEKEACIFWRKSSVVLMELSHLRASPEASSSARTSLRDTLGREETTIFWVQGQECKCRKYWTKKLQTCPYLSTNNHT